MKLVYVERCRYLDFNKNHVLHSDSRTVNQRIRTLPWLNTESATIQIVSTLTEIGEYITYNCVKLNYISDIPTENWRVRNQFPPHWTHYISVFTLLIWIIFAGKDEYPLQVLARASGRFNVHTISYSLIHFGGPTSIGRFRFAIFGGPRDLPTTTAVWTTGSLTSFATFLAPRIPRLDSWWAALTAAGPRNSILARFLVRRMWRLAVRRRHLSDLHTFNHLRETSAARCKEAGSNLRSIKCETSSGSSAMRSTLHGTNRPTARNRDLKNSMLLQLLRERDWRSGWELSLIYVRFVMVDCKFRFRVRALAGQHRARVHEFSDIYLANSWSFALALSEPNSLYRNLEFLVSKYVVEYF
jgi:hypothetical protein